MTIYTFEKEKIEGLFSSPLTLLAMGELSFKARIARIAAMIGTVTGPSRRGEITALDAKWIVSVVGEPRGRKGEMATALVEEFDKQRDIRADRWYERDTRCGCERLYTVSVADYMPSLCPASCRQNPEWTSLRRKCLVVARMYRYAAPKMREFATQEGFRWSEIHGKASSHRYRDTKLGKGTVTAVFQPDRVDERYMMDHRYLLHASPDMFVAVRVHKRASSIYKAIESLKTSVVKKAEERGDIVQLDLPNEQWLVRSPKRKKWRKLPFKQHSRNRS